MYEWWNDIGCILNFTLFFIKKILCWLGKKTSFELGSEAYCTHCKGQVKVPSQYCLPFRAEKLCLRFTILYLNAREKLTLVNPWKEDAYFLWNLSQSRLSATSLTSRLKSLKSSLSTIISYNLQKTSKHWIVGWGCQWDSKTYPLLLLTLVNKRHYCWRHLELQKQSWDRIDIFGLR